MSYLEYFCPGTLILIVPLIIEGAPVVPSKFFPKIGMDAVAHVLRKSS